MNILLKLLATVAIWMPGKRVKNWKAYHALRRKGFSKSKSAKIANSRRRRKK